MLPPSFIIFSAIFNVGFTLKADDYFKICKRNDPDLNGCVMKSLEQVRPLLIKGSKDLRIPSVEPMIVPKVQVQQGSGPVSIDSSFYDLHVNGITNYTIKNVSVVQKKNLTTIKVEVAIPYLFMSGDYEIKGQVLILPIAGKGDSWSNYTGVTGVMTLNLSNFDKNGKTFLNLRKLNFSIAVKQATIHMNNLFNGNKELGDAMNRFMSVNWEIVFQELKPVVDTAVSSLLENVAVKVFEIFSYDELFPV